MVPWIWGHNYVTLVLYGFHFMILIYVFRPVGPVNIKPLTPATDTRAPAFPQSPTRAPQVRHMFLFIC